MKKGRIVGLYDESMELEMFRVSIFTTKLYFTMYLPISIISYIELEKNIFEIHMHFL